MVGTTIGADRLAEWTVETWTGRSPRPIVFWTAAALVALGAVSAAINSGLVPTFLLVGSPLFGAGLARYGAEYTVLGTTHAVSLGEAFADGAGAAIGIGFPLAAGGFLLGVAVRRAIERGRGARRTVRPNGL